MTDLAWFKSSYSGGAENCAEVAHGQKIVHLRDTKDRDGGTLIFSRTDWNSLLASLTSQT